MRERDTARPGSRQVVRSRNVCGRGRERDTARARYGSRGGRHCLSAVSRRHGWGLPARAWELSFVVQNLPDRHSQTRGNDRVTGPSHPIGNVQEGLPPFHCPQLPHRCSQSTFRTSGIPINTSRVLSDVVKVSPTSTATGRVATAAHGSSWVWARWCIAEQPDTASGSRLPPEHAPFRLGSEQLDPASGSRLPPEHAPFNESSD